MTSIGSGSPGRSRRTGDAIAAGAAAAVAMTAVILNGIRRHGASPVDPTPENTATSTGDKGHQ